MKKCLPVLMLLSMTLSAAGQNTKVPSPAAVGKQVCIPADKARLMDADLRRLPLVLDENDSLRVAAKGFAAESHRLRLSLAAKDTALAARTRQVYFTGLLRDDAQAQSNAWKLKAKKRWWIIVAESALMVGAGALIITR